MEKNINTYFSQIFQEVNQSFAEHNRQKDLAEIQNHVSDLIKEFQKLNYD
jgi:hypothetical protein